MSIFGKRISGYVRKIEGGKCIDVPVLIKIRGDEVVVKDMRIFSRKEAYAIRPTRASLYVSRNALERKERGTFDLWYLYIADDVTVHEFRVQRLEGEAMKKRIDRIIEGGK